MTLEEFKLIFDQYYEPVKNFLYYKSGNVALSEDLSQDVFLKLWEKRDTVNQETVKSLLYTIANNLFINQLKKNKVSFNFILNEGLSDKNTESPQYEMEMKEFGEHLQRVLAELPEKSREVFLMNRIDKLKYREIAERLDISVKAVEKRMTKAIALLEDKLSRRI